MSEPPDHPEGYRDPQEYQHTPLSISVSFLVVSVLAIPVFLHAMDSLPSLESLVVLPPLVLILAEVHERMHYLSFSLLGYSPKIHRRFWMAHRVTAPNQFVKANHNIIALLTPLFVIGLFSTWIILLDVGYTLTFYLGNVVFILNTMSSIYDVSGAYRDYEFPDDTLVYDATQIYLPAEE
jgi:hypothetical protein